MQLYDLLGKKKWENIQTNCIKCAYGYNYRPCYQTVTALQCVLPPSGHYWYYCYQKQIY